MSTRLVLRALGRASAEIRSGDDRRVPRIEPKRLALLFYLATPRLGRLHEREAVAAVFWPEREPARATAALRQAFHHLRQRIGDFAFVGLGRGRIGLDPEVVRYDVDDFERAVDEGRHERALSLYRGPFLDGLAMRGPAELEEWAAFERRRLNTRALASTVALADRTEAAGALATTAGWLHRALELAPLDEGLLGRQIGVLRHLKDPAAADRAYDTFQRRFTTDLGLAVSPRLRSLLLEPRDAAGRGRGREELRRARQLKLRTDELAEAHVLLEALLSSLQAGIVIVDSDLEVMAWSSAATALWGVPPERAIGEDLASLEIGLPIGRLRDEILACARGMRSRSERVVDATDARGRRIRCRVRSFPFVAGNDDRRSAVVLMEEVG